MKIAVIGYSGSGKSTLSSKIGEIYGIEVLHLDKVHWLSGCNEKIDFQFVKWILFDGRNKHHKQNYNSILHLYGEKLTIINN